MVILMKKVYLVWEVEYTAFSPSQHLKRIYADKAKADKYCKTLNKKYSRSVEEDGYGPYAGLEFKVYECKVQ
jgi:hypothetical protein